MYNNMTVAEWEHEFADIFFDNIVDHEIKTFGKRILDEGTIYAIAYDNAVATTEKHKEVSPELMANIIFAQLLTKEKNV